MSNLNAEIGWVLSDNFRVGQLPAGVRKLPVFFEMSNFKC